MSDDKVPVNLRLSAEAVRQADELKKQLGISRTAVVELAIRAYSDANLKPKPDTSK
jgi:hypothetical protein